MSTAAKFSNNVEISGNIDISGDINVGGKLTVDGSFSLYGYDIPDPIGENNKVLTISGDGYSWETVQSGDEVINSIGQTFYEIITEQPREFDISLINDSSFASTFSKIEIAWNFDQLIPKDEHNQQQILNITGDLNQRVLPCITHIYFDISSNQSGTKFDSSQFVIAVDASDNYNVDAPTTTVQQTWSIGDAYLNSTLTYKTLTLTNVNTDALLYKYTVRIWGENQSNGTDVNKLTYSNLEFLSSGIPKTPTINSVTPSGNDTAKLDLSLNVPDIDIVNDNTVINGSDSIFIKNVDISVTEIETLRSTTYSSYENSFELTSSDLTVNDQSQPDTSVQDISVNVSYQDASFNLGSKYEIQAKCKNALNASDGSNNDGYTSYSTVFQMADFIDIPTSDDENTSNPFENTPIVNQEYNNTTMSIKTTGDGNRSISIYLIDNLDSDARITPSRTSNSIVEITNPSKTKSDSTGYGKYIDNSENIISINCLLYKDGSLDASLQQVDYHGWEFDPSFTSYLKDDNITPFVSLTTQDQESNSESHKQGFRLQAVYKTETNSLKIIDLSNNNIIGPFDPSCSEGYKIQYNLVRSDDYNTTNPTRTSGEFYVDSFPNYADPSYNTESSSIVVSDISWVMGIPQVSTVDISFTRNHININSEYKYFQSDGLVAEVNSIKANNDDDVYSSGTKNYLYVSYANLNTDGSYNGSFDGSLNYSNIDSSQTSNTVNSLVVNTDVSNLYTVKNYDETFSVAHYRDVTSISNKSTVFGTNSIYELNSSNISNLGSNFYSVHTSLVLYDNSNHEKEIQSYTIPFISGSFTVDYSEYPDICGSFEWDGTLPTTFTNAVYDSSSSGIDLDGNSGDYKWIVYKIDEYDSDEYLTGSTSGVNLSYILVKLFGTTVEDNFYNSLYTYNYTGDQSELLVNIVGKNKSSGDWFFGRINHESPGFNSSSKWYTANKIITSKSLTTLRDATSFTYTGALPGSTLQGTIRTAAGWADTADEVNGHSPIVILTFSNDLDNHYLYFGLRD